MNAVEDNSSEPQQAAWVPPVPPADTMPLPGATLAAARVAQGLSLEDIARQLKLSVAQIKSIEADDHSRLPSPVFVRGFIRTYARVLKLDIAQVQPPKVVVPENPDVRMMQDAPRASMEPNPYRRVPSNRWLLLGHAATRQLGPGRVTHWQSPPPGTVGNDRR